VKGESKVSERTDETEREESFFVRDTKGRTVGARARMWKEDGRFCYRPGALRNGQPFGANQPAGRFGTEAERDAAVEKYFTGARKRAAKAAART